MLAATVRVTGDLDLAEECVQDAYVVALDAWLHDGVPDKPGAWLTTAARRRALDAHRRERILRAKLPLMVEPEESTVEDITADRLRLIFTCCHPASLGRHRSRSPCGWSAGSAPPKSPMRS